MSRLEATEAHHTTTLTDVHPISKRLLDAGFFTAANGPRTQTCPREVGRRSSPTRMSLREQPPASAIAIAPSSGMTATSRVVDPRLSHFYWTCNMHIVVGTDLSHAAGEATKAGALVE